MAMKMKSAAMKKAASGMKKAVMKKAPKAASGMKKAPAMKKKSSSAMKKKKAMKKSVVAKGKRAKQSVFRGTKEKTIGGLTKDKLKRSKSGKIVSKAQSDAAKKKPSFKKILKWSESFMQARKQLGVKGFVAPKKGTKLYEATKKIYDVKTKGM